MKQDYYSVLARAVAAIDPQDPESRRAVYDRARYAMARAPLTLDEIRRQRLILEAAIRRIEGEIVSGRGVSVPRATDRSRDDVRDAIARVPMSSSRRARRSLRLAIFGCAAAAISIAALVGYRYWHKPVVEDVRALAQAPIRNFVRTEARIAREENRSYIFNRQIVYYRSIHPAGTIVIAKSQNFLYLVRPKTAAMRYTIGVGPECLNVVGLLLVSAKEDWSAGGSETSGNDVRLVRIAGGRFGARSLALSDTGYRIHGSDAPVSGRVIGCFPLVNEDVIDLYERVQLGTRVVMN